MKYLLYPGLPVVALIAETTAPDHPLTLILWYFIAILFSMGALLLILYAIARWLRLID